MKKLKNFDLFKDSKIQEIKEDLYFCCEASQEIIFFHQIDKINSLSGKKLYTYLKRIGR
jgi:hypothetical protein